MISRIAILWAGTVGCELTRFFSKSGVHISVYYSNSGGLSLLVMGVADNNNAKLYGITCQELDDYTKYSYQRSANAWQKGWFNEEVISTDAAQKKVNYITVSTDEGFLKNNFEKPRTLKPAFSPEGKATAANAGPISYNAGALNRINIQ